MSDIKFRTFYVLLEEGPSVTVPVFQDVSDEDQKKTAPEFFGVEGYLDPDDAIEELKVGGLHIATIPIDLNDARDGVELVDVFDALISFSRSIDPSGEAACNVENLLERMFELAFQRGMEYAIRHPETIKAATLAPGRDLGR